MSVAVMQRVFEMRLEPTDLAVMIALADWADADGTCFPGHDAILARIAISRSTLIRRLASLEERGLIKRERRTRSDGARTSDRYQLFPGVADDLGVNLTHGTGDTAKVSTVTPTEELRSSEPSVEPSGISAREGEWFEAVWSQWPKKAGKQPARDAFMKMAVHQGHDSLRIGGICGQLVNLGRAYAQHVPENFQPHLSTIINQKRWDDPLPTERTSSSYRTVDQRTEDYLREKLGGQL